MDKADMIYDLSVVWATVKEEFPYFDRLPINWDDQYCSYIDRILGIDNSDEFHRLLKAFVDCLNDGHTRYIPPAKFRDKKPLVRPDPPSYNVAGNVLTIKLNDFLSDHSIYVRELLKSYPDVKLVELDIRDNIGGNTTYAAKVAQLFISGVFHGCQKWTQLRKANDIASASQIITCDETTLQRYVVDGLLTQEDISEANSVMNHTKYEIYIDSYGSENSLAVYTGPLHLLISKGTVSAAEDFTAMFKSNHRATLIGEPTYGSTGTPCLIKLRCGGLLEVVSVGYRLLDGTEFIGKGITPDIFHTT